MDLNRREVRVKIVLACKNKQTDKDLFVPVLAIINCCPVA